MLPIEDGVDPMEHPCWTFVAFRLAARGASRIRLLAGFAIRVTLRKLPELDVGALLALPYLPPMLLCLTVRQPPRVLETLSSRDRHQMEGIPTPVDLAGGGIKRKLQDTRLPRLLPRSGAFLQHGNNLIGDLLSKVATG